MAANLENSSFDAFMESAWTAHGERPDDVAAQLADALTLPQDAAQLQRFASLATHVYGEHLARWRDGVVLLDRLRTTPAFDGGGDAMRALDRHVATLRHAAGDADALDALARDDRAAALAAAASALAGRQAFERAIDAYAAACALAAAGIPKDSPANRALAVGGNNLATALEEKRDRTPRETQAMLDAAQSALVHWRIAGTWVQEMWAHYRLARSRLCAGDAQGAIDSAVHCIALCDTNHAPPFEFFFGYAALALARRAAAENAAFEDARTRALALYESLADDERPLAAADLAAIESPAPGT
ncbi:MAG TPA: hypothetical protein VGR63_09590 [Casimicrobiaceae bacterium]|nr:hypothetical protein [Casimicrobiaceae bacterium]